MGDALVLLAVTVLFPTWLPLPAMVAVSVCAVAVRSGLERDLRRDRPSGLPLLVPLGWWVLGVVGSALAVLVVATEGGAVLAVVWLTVPVGWLLAVLLRARDVRRAGG
jgi:hypothetical protein